MSIFVRKLIFVPFSQGSVLMVSHGTTDVVLGVVGDGDIIGDTDFVLGTAHALSYVAESDCECLELDASVFLKALFVQVSFFIIIFVSYYFIILFIICSILKLRLDSFVFCAQQYHFELRKLPAS
jgi:CRP-like cAMP-binding protein